MSELDRIVNVRIAKETATISQKSFGVPLIVFQGDSNFPAAWGVKLPEHSVKTFFSLKEISEAFEDDGNIKVADMDFYKAAQAVFAQNPKVLKLQLGRLSDDSDDYASVKSDLDAIAIAEGDFYFVLPAMEIDEDEAGIDSSENKQKWMAFADFAEEEERFLFVQPATNDNIFNNDSGTPENSLAYIWRGFTKTAVCAKSAGFQFPSAWVGEGAPFDPGSSTWAYKRPAGVNPIKTTGSDLAANKDNNWFNVYHTVYGQNITEPGKTVSGEWIDVEIGIDWLKVRLQEAIFGDLVRQRKIPYDDVGIQIIRGTIAKILDLAAQRGILQGDSIVISTPRFEDIPKNDVGARHLPDIKFTTTVLNAIHTTTIDGTVTL